MEILISSEDSISISKSFWEWCGYEWIEVQWNGVKQPNKLQKAQEDCYNDEYILLKQCVNGNI